MNAPDTQAAKQFVVDQFRWLRQVAADRELPPSAAAVAIALTQYLNRSTREAWPAQETLAATLGLTARCIRSSLAAMTRRRHLELVGHGNGGRHRSNTYRMSLKPMAQNNETTKPGTPVPPFGANVTPGPETRKASDRNPENPGQKPGTYVPPNLNRTYREPLRDKNLDFEGRKEEVSREGSEQVARLVSVTATELVALPSYPRRTDYKPQTRPPRDQADVESSLRRWEAAKRAHAATLREAGRG